MALLLWLIDPSYLIMFLSRSRGSVPVTNGSFQRCSPVQWARQANFCTNKSRKWWNVWRKWTFFHLEEKAGVAHSYGRTVGWNYLFERSSKNVLNETQAEPPRWFFFLISKQYMLDKQQETFSHVRIYYKCSTNTFTDSSKSISTTVERILIMFLLHRATFIASYCTLSCWLPINVVNNNNCPQYIVETSVIKWKY